MDFIEFGWWVFWCANILGAIIVAPYVFELILFAISLWHEKHDKGDFQE